MDKSEFFKLAYDTVVEANEGRALRLIQKAEDQGMDLLELLKEGFGQGHQQMGDLFEKGQISLPELIFATEVTRKAVEMIENRTHSRQRTVDGKVLVATVSGDIHDIGKNIVAYTMIVSGIEVIDLGRDVPVEVIIQKAEELEVKIIATSALLTSTLKEQKKLEDMLRKMGLRSKYITLVGGAPCTGRWAKRIGADAYCEDAAEAVRIVKGFLEKNGARRSNERSG